MHPVLRKLPDHLAERCRVLVDGPVADGNMVLYWLRQAQRGHENPALDVAAALATALDRALYVHQSLSPAYPYASDRFCRFVLEGAVDLHRQLADQGIASAFYLEPSDRQREMAVAAKLAKGAAVVVLEDVPVDPWRWQARRLSRSIDAPVLVVDAACTLPMRLVAKRPDRAFAFRRQTERARADRLALPWPQREDPVPSVLPSALPFSRLDLDGSALGDLVARMAIDHGIGPIADTPGGSTAGYVRWTAFRDGGLRSYARRRNDASDRDGVSRMSPYLHHGQVSPFTLAREARLIGGAGAEKWLDEFLIWRELAHVWCFHTREAETVEALPRWAQATLAAHANDLRPATYDEERLASGSTGDALWDAAQTSLLVHGELHNNLRMTWGKALVGWSPTPAAALRRLVDLNNRYALDGRDANSYGGLLWCLGLFDRPFEPPQPVIGTLRPRATTDHARRLDVSAYTADVDRPNGGPPLRIAVIGAGIAGLACARTLADHRHEVVVLDKSRGLGGRMATRRAEPLTFDHGAQYFTAREPRFVRNVAAWAERGLVAPWTPTGRPDRAETWWVATPRMTALARHLGAELDVRGEITVTAVRRDEHGWSVTAGEARLGPFDAVVVAVPAPQAVPLLAPSPTLADATSAAVMHPCWAAMLGFPDRLDLPDVVRPSRGPLAWMARDASKPGRGEAETWVLHASPEWSIANLEREREAVLLDLQAAFADIVGAPPPALHRSAHRWRYALTVEPVGQTCLWDERGLAACGDWCLGGRIEAAYLSGIGAAGRILNVAVDAARR